MVKKIIIDETPDADVHNKLKIEIYGTCKVPDWKLWEIQNAKIRKQLGNKNNGWVHFDKEPNVTIDALENEARGQ